MGLSFEKILLLLFLVAIIIGPDRLPAYTQKLAEFIRAVKRFSADAKTQLQNEMGAEFNDVNWRKYDPRQYDPRQILQDAISQSADLEAAAAGKERAASLSHSVQLAPDGQLVKGANLAGQARSDSTVPFDSEAT